MSAGKSKVSRNIISSVPSSGTGGNLNSRCEFINSDRERTVEKWHVISSGILANRSRGLCAYSTVPCNGMPFMNSSRFGCSGPRLGWMKSAMPALAVKVDDSIGIGESKSNALLFGALTDFTRIGKRKRPIDGGEQCIGRPAVIIDAAHKAFVGAW